MEEQKKKHSHTGHRQRIKTKALEGGIEHWPIHEVLELILTYSIPYKDVNPLAHELIDTFGTLGGVLDAGYEQLVKIKGVGHETALFLSLLPDLFTKYTASKNIGPILLDTTQKCVRYFRTIDRVKTCEDFYMFCLNSKKKLIKTFKYNSKLAEAVSVPLTGFLQGIASCNAFSVIIMHSHPSGDPQPTKSDVEATKRFIATAAAVGVKIDDHIIITDNSYYSFLQDDFLLGLKKQVDPDNLLGSRSELED